MKQFVNVPKLATGDQVAVISPSANYFPLLLGRTVTDPARAQFGAFGAYNLRNRDEVEQPKFYARLVQEALRTTADSIRACGEPTTVLHALFYEDALSLGELAGVLHVDPRDIELDVAQQVDVGVICVDKSSADPTYSIPF